MYQMVTQARQVDLIFMNVPVPTAPGRTNMSESDTPDETKRFRTEHDSLGEVAVPAGVLFGAQTQRAGENFPVSGRRLPRRMIRALGLIKRAAAQTNKASGALAPQLADAIVQAADEVAARAATTTRSWWTSSRPGPARP